MAVLHHAPRRRVTSALIGFTMLACGLMAL
jgi:hypothetical protein